MTKKKDDDNDPLSFLKENETSGSPTEVPVNKEDEVGNDPMLSRKEKIPISRVGGENLKNVDNLRAKEEEGKEGHKDNSGNEGSTEPGLATDPVRTSEQDPATVKQREKKPEIYREPNHIAGRTVLMSAAEKETYHRLLREMEDSLEGASLDGLPMSHSVHKKRAELDSFLAGLRT